TRNTIKLKVLAENILDISKIESNSLKLNKQNFSLDSLILDIVKEFGAKLGDENKEIKFEYSSSTDAYTLVYGDKNRIGQVMSNLIGNSIKFTNQKEGTISINIRKGKKIDNDKDSSVVVEIKDTGVGIDPEIFPKLFTKFATKSFQGTGLGLYICKNIIEAHGGQIWAENNINNSNKDGKKGATFSFSMPLKD
ncbi:MAG TPA: HAMP domain-containing sensor histidine kinase, partial [Nitrososphaeraceae archaeon]|nr:HAMP domain-containing sensor histidine kinase [Nitrososphaeraceae archaeon]